MNTHELVQAEDVTNEEGEHQELEHEEGEQTLMFTESAKANAHEEKTSYHYEYREQLLTQAANAVGGTYGNIHENYLQALLTQRHRSRALMR